jgi:hypothetical protein
LNKERLPQGTGNVTPEQEPDWDKIIKAAKTPEERAAVLKKILAEAEKDVLASGLSEAEREALILEIMQSDDDDE